MVYAPEKYALPASQARRGGLGQGDEVIASTLTLIGGVSSILFQGATPVFIDSDRNSWNMDPDLLAHELEKGPERILVSKAVVLWGIFG